MKPHSCFGLVLITTALWAGDRDDRERQDGGRHLPRVVLYEHADHQGDALVLFPGDEIENMSGATFAHGAKLNDGISSLRVDGEVAIVAYEHARFRGEALRLTENVRDLSGRLLPGNVGASWNDRISSLRVERVRGRYIGKPDEPGRAHPEKVIRAVFTDLLGREPDAGEARDFRTRMTDQGWTEKMIRDHLRREDRYRREKADLLINRAYLEVLGREPDASGRKQYRWALLDKHWTEGDVRDDLRRSEEYRRKPPVANAAASAGSRRNPR